MFHIDDVLHLNERERLLGVIRRHPIVLVRRLFWVLILIVLPFFFIFPLISWGTPGMLLFLILVLTGTIRAVRSMILWNTHVLIGTTERLVLVQERGLFSRFVTDISFPDIQDITWEKRGVIDTFFKLGLIRVRQRNSEAEIVFTRVSRPQEFCSMIQEARNPEIIRTAETPARVFSVSELMVCINSLPHHERKDLFEKCGIGGGLEESEALPVVRRDI
ncbi:MAG: hypothetical protein NUV81_02190 [bacterium]|nr:hypothetical protein [bacterium]